jgi:hypothetical protein
MTFITVTLHDGESPPQRITVAVTDSIHTLHSHVPGGSRRLIIYRGSLLMTAFSFNHHGIKDGDDLYIARPASKHSYHPPLPIAREGLLRGGNTVLMEASRLSDLGRATAELRASAVGRKEEGGPEAVNATGQTILGDTDPEEPSTTPLPPCW